MPIVVPSPDAIVVDDFLSSLYPVASFILRRNSTNTPPTRNPPPPPNHANHDESAAARAAPSPIPPPLQRISTRTTETTWAGIVRTNHPNPQHVPYSEGRGPSSKRRYRKRATRRRLLTTNTLSLLLPLSISSLTTGIHKSPDAHSRTLSTLRKIHNKHHSILIPTIKDNIDVQEESTTDTEHKLEQCIEQTIIDIHSISNTFDNIAKRIELSFLEKDQHNTEVNTLLSKFDHEYILSADATLHHALVEFTTYTNSLFDQHNVIMDKICTNNTTKNENGILPYYHDDEYSLDLDDDVDTRELEELYKTTTPHKDDANPTCAPNLMPLTTKPILSDHSHEPKRQLDLISLLLRYQEMTTTTSDQQPNHYSNTAPHMNRHTNTPLTETKPTTARQLPILPPMPPNLEAPTNPRHCAIPHMRGNELPILPPIIPIPTRPESEAPRTWTHQSYPHQPQQQQAKDNTEWETEWESNHQSHDEATQNTDITSPPLPPPKLHQHTSRRTHYNHRRPHSTTIKCHKNDRTFVNEIVCVTQNVRGLPTEDDTKLQSLVHQMKERNWAAMCLQETWRLGDDEFYIDDHKVILKGNTTKTNEMGHVMGGVCIILSPELDAAHKLALNKKITLPKNHKHEGRFIGVHLHFNKRDSHGKRIKGTMKLVLCSIYHPVDSREHDDFNGTTQTILNQIQTNTQLIFGQDINCNVGTAPNKDDPFRRAVGPHGLNNRNHKGTRFLQHLCSLDMKIANSFFVKTNYATWKNFKPSRPSYHMLDVFSVSNTLFKHVKDCGTTPHGTDCTDHTATFITLNINSIAIQSKRQNKTNATLRADWHQIINDNETNQSFNHKLNTEIQHTNPRDDYTTFFELVKNTAESTAIKPEKKINAWFTMSKDTLQPAIDRVTALQHSIRDPSNQNKLATKRELQLAYRLRNIAVREAKSKYMSHIAQRIGTLSGENTRAMWEAIKECKLGHENNYIRPQIMSLTKEDGSRTTNNKDNIEIMRSHCEKLFNNKKQVSPNALNLIDQRETEPDLDRPITWKEFTKAINGLRNNKSPGANEIPAEAFKAMNNENRNHVFAFINAFWNNETDYPEWHTGLGVPVQKVSQPSNPNQYRIVNLMDVCSKIFSKILTTRLYKLLDKHGTKYQFGATPQSGCQDANYTLKTLLHLRRQHNLGTFVVFADLVKAFDTSDHALIIDILRKYGAPPKLCNSIERLYSDLHVTLKIGKETTDINQSVGVRQGDNLSPVIFLFVMSAFSEILDKKWTAAGITKVEAKHTPLNELANGQLTGHKNPLKKRGSTTHITQTLFLDDSGFPFNTREEAITGTKLVKETFASLGLEMHCGNKTTDKSKTEILWVPPPSFYTDAARNEHRNQSSITPQPTNHTELTYENPSIDTTDEFDNEIPQQTVTTQTASRTRPLTFCTMTMQQREELYWQSPTTNRIELDNDGSFIDFTAHFKYLGSFISFDLTDDMDIRHRITKANQAMGALRHFWRNPYADLHAKKSIFLAIPANLLLWGCETWALRQSHIDKLNVFWHRAIRNILGIRMSEVIDDHISNEQIRKIFHNIPDAEAILNARSMNFLGKTARAPDVHPPKLLMTAWINNPRPKSGVLATNKKAMVRSLNALLPEETRESTTSKCRTTGITTTSKRHNPDGILKNWLHIALDKELWNWHIYKLTHPNSQLPPRPNPARTRERRHDTNNENEDNTNHQDHQERQEHQGHQGPSNDNDSNHNRDNTRNERTHRSDNRRNSHQDNSPPPNPSQNHECSNYNTENVGRTRHDSILALGLRPNATLAEVKHRFRTLSLIYHPDKYNESLGIPKRIATEHFQLLNNAYMFLRGST